MEPIRWAALEAANLATARRIVLTPNFRLCIVEMKCRRAARNIQQASDLPCGFTLRGPFKAFEFSRRQRDTINDPVDRQPSACMSMKIHRHELEHRPILLDAALERRAALVRGECDRRDRATRVMHGHREATADTEMRRLVEQRALRLRQTLHREFVSPLERLCGCQRLNDDRIDPLIVLPQIMIGPLGRVVRDELGASPRRDGMERYAKQLRSSAAPALPSTVRRRTMSPLAARPSINAWNTRCMRHSELSSPVALGSSPLKSGRGWLSDHGPSWALTASSTSTQNRLIPRLQPMRLRGQTSWTMSPAFSFEATPLHRESLAASDPPVGCTLGDRLAAIVRQCAIHPVQFSANQGARRYATVSGDFRSIASIPLPLSVDGHLGSRSGARWPLVTR